MKYWITSAVLAGCFLLLALALNTSGLAVLDQRIGDYFFSLRTESWNQVIEAFSGLGTTKGYLAVFGIILIITLIWKKWGHAIWLTAALAAGWLLNKGLKAWIHRERPIHWESLVEPDGYSFPSGNAMVSAAFYGLLALILFSSRRSWVRVSGACVLLLILLIGLSRLYLGVHFVSDIAGGLLAGASIAFACYAGWRRSRWARK